MEIDSKIIKKWAPVIDGLPIKNRFIKEHMSNYLEWSITQGEDADNLKSSMNDILVAIENTSRIEIVGKFFNTTTGIIEYKLSDGTYVPIAGEVNRKLSNNEMLKMFGIDYLKHYDLETFRDLKIDEIYGGTD